MTIAQVRGATTIKVMPNESAALRAINNAISGSRGMEAGGRDLRAPAKLAEPCAHEELKEMG